MGIAICRECLHHQADIEGDGRSSPSRGTGVPRHKTLDMQDEEEIERAESFRTNPVAESFDEGGRSKSTSFATLVPEKASFGTLVPDRLSFNTLLPDSQSFATIPRVDSFSGYSQVSHSTLVPQRQSFQTVPGGASMPNSRCASFSTDSPDYAPPAHGYYNKAAEHEQLYGHSLEAQAARNNDVIMYQHGAAKVAPSWKY